MHALMQRKQGCYRQCYWAYLQSSFVKHGRHHLHPKQVLHLCVSTSFVSIFSSTISYLTKSAFSVVENSIALIVGSVPAWKAIWKKHVITSRFYKTLTSKLHGNGTGHSDGTHHSKAFGFNRPASRAQAPRLSGSEKSLQRFVSHRENSDNEFSNYYAPPVVQIQGGNQSGHRKADSEDMSAGGIIRNYDITREVHPGEQV
jgi:hypothetical protein